MDTQRYVLTLQNADVFKEVELSAEQPQLRVGTLQDCDVRMKNELFAVPILIDIHYEAGRWYLTCEEPLCFLSNTRQEYRKTILKHGDVFQLFLESSKSNILTLHFSYDFSLAESEFDSMLDIRNVDRIVIGGTPSAQLHLTSRYVGSEYLSLTRRTNGELQMDATHAPVSATLNGIRVSALETIRELDFFGVADYRFYYKNGILYTANRKDIHTHGIRLEPLRIETPAFHYPKFNRSPRMLHTFDTEPFEILNPPKKPEKPRDSLVLHLAPALLMLAVVVITRSGLIEGLGGGNISFLILSLSTMVVGIFTSVLSFVFSRRQYRKDLQVWKNDYDAYIAARRAEIEAEQKTECEVLAKIYPSEEQLRDFVKTFSSRLFERSPQDNDFLNVRAGLGAIPALRQPTSNQKQEIKEDSELAPIPEQLCREYQMIRPAPVLLHLRETGSLGVVGSEIDQYEFFKKVVLDICVLHHFEDVHLIVLLPQDQQEKYAWIKWLPHIKNAAGNVRGIVCDDESRDDVFEYLYALLLERSAAVEGDAAGPPPVPHIVVLAMDEHGIKTHPLFRFVCQAPKLGLSLVFFKQYIENLPRECQEIVTLKEQTGVLYLRSNNQFERNFTWERVEDDSIRFVAERLTPVYCEKIALASRLTANITLFELLNIIAPDNLNLAERWSKANVQRSLAAPLGVDVRGSVVNLDLHERAHGPHGLVAGTTGSGKSEIMQSYILSAAVSFHPYEVAFVIIDFKGGGMANQFENLPHLIGKITDIDDYEIDRSLRSIHAEIDKRKRLFAEQEVNHIDQYIAKFRSGATNIALPHLILIVDEFAELKADQPEFMKELISTARVGRSLGIHLILATQKPAGQVNEQIWSNSRFKLCLKVATKEDSNEVLRSPLAAEILEPGRAYMQVGNNEVFTLFQSAYSGASAASDKNGNIREFTISEVSFTGKRTVIYQRKAQKTADGNKVTQLKALVDYINAYCKQANIKRLPSICMPPLPERISYHSVALSSGNVVVVGIGIYDDPANQVQPEVQIGLSAGNVIIIGSAQTGKTMLLQTILRSATEQYSPQQISVYILDFASKILTVFDELNHVGGVMTDADDEKLKNFFKMIRAELNERKERFSRLGISSYEAYLQMPREGDVDLPRILLIVDNLAAFREFYPDYEDTMINFCREGVALGMTVVATAKQTSGLSYRYLNSFPTRISFNCTDSGEYSTLFDRNQLRPRNLQGRGLTAINKVVYEYQAYLAFDGEQENQRVNQARAFIAQMNNRYKKKRARRVPEIPAVLTNDHWSNAIFAPYEVPVALTYGEIKTIALDLAHIGTLGIFGRKGFGKSNLLRAVLQYLQRNVFDLPCQAYLIDSYDKQLAEFNNCGFVEQITIDCGDFEEILNIFTDAAKHRMDIVQEGGNLDKEPLLLCVVQNQKIYAPDTLSRDICEQFKKLLRDIQQLKMCFIFADIDNNSDYSPPEILRVVREFSQFILLDDLQNVKFLGSNKITSADLKQYKKPLSIGDGYHYDPRSGFEKIKVVKCERGE